MRRSFWAIAGALLGVTGYRRAVRLGRAVGIGGGRGAQPRARRSRDFKRGWTRSAVLFARDVRDGMEIYTDRHPRLAGRTLERQQASAQRPRRAAAGAAPTGASPGANNAKDGR